MQQLPCGGRFLFRHCQPPPHWPRAQGSVAGTFPRAALAALPSASSMGSLFPRSATAPLSQYIQQPTGAHYGQAGAEDNLHAVPKPLFGGGKKHGAGAKKTALVAPALLKWAGELMTETSMKHALSLMRCSSKSMSARLEVAKDNSRFLVKARISC